MDLLPGKRQSEILLPLGPSTGCQLSGEACSTSLSFRQIPIPPIFKCDPSKRPFLIAAGTF